MTPHSTEVGAAGPADGAATALLMSLADPVVWIRDSEITWVSPRVRLALGWQPDDLTGRDFDDFVHPEDRQQVSADRSSLTSSPSVLRRLRLRGSDGRYHWVDGHASPVVDGAGNRDGLVLCLRVVDDAVQAEQELTRRARFDQLTGLLNRDEVISRISAAGSHHRRSDTHHAVLFCDVDHLKPVNDGMGHLVGDELLRQVATRIVDSIRVDDQAARLGGDEFLILLDGVGELQDAVAVAEKIRAAVSAPMTVLGHPMRASVSIGIAMIHPGQDALDVIASADSAMYEAKRGHGEGIASARRRERALPAPAEPSQVQEPVEP